jgi:hypothetical protein
MARPPRFDRTLVRKELAAVYDVGRQRILNLGGSCDPVEIMVRQSMRKLDRLQSERTNG